jgi:hypothetical protein
LLGLFPARVPDSRIIVTELRRLVPVGIDPTEAPMSTCGVNVSESCEQPYFALWVVQCRAGCAQSAEHRVRVGDEFRVPGVEAESGG